VGQALKSLMAEWVTALLSSSLPPSLAFLDNAPVQKGRDPVRVHAYTKQMSGLNTPVHIDSS
jgi:hypothetical protein